MSSDVNKCDYRNSCDTSNSEEIRVESCIEPAIGGLMCIGLPGMFPRL